MFSTPSPPTATSSSSSRRTRPRTWAISTRPTRGPSSRSPLSPTDQLDLYAELRLHRQQDHRHGGSRRVIGNQAPLVSSDTINAGVQYRQPFGNGLTGTARLDYNEIGRTWWEPYNVTSRDPVSWSICAWGCRGEQLVADRLVEEPDQHDLQRRVLARAAVPVAGAAAALRRRLRLQVLIRRNLSWPHRPSCRPAPSHGLRHAGPGEDAAASTRR